MQISQEQKQMFHMQITYLPHPLNQTDRTVISWRSPASQSPRAHKSKLELRDLSAAAAVLDGTPSSIISSFPHGGATQQQPQRSPLAPSIWSSFPFFMEFVLMHRLRSGAAHKPA